MTHLRNCCCDGLCCGSGNQCLFLPSHGSPFLNGFDSAYIASASDTVRPVGFTEGYAALGLAFDVVSAMTYTQRNIETVYPSGPIEDWEETGVDHDTTATIELEEHRARYRFIPAGLDEEEIEELLGEPVGTGWIESFTMVDASTGNPARVCYVDPDPLVGTWSVDGFPSIPDGTGTIAPGGGIPMGMEQFLPIHLNGLSKLLVRQENPIGTVNPGDCDGIGWNPMPFFDAVNPASPVRINNTAGPFAYWNHPLWFFPGIDDDGITLFDWISGPASMALHRRGGSYNADPMIVVLDLSSLPASIDYIQHFDRTMSGTVDVNHAITDTRLSAVGSVNGELVLFDNDDITELFGPIDYRAELNVTSRVERIMPCPGDDSLPTLECDRDPLTAFAAVLCDPDDAGDRVIGYDPSARPADGVTMIFGGKVYIPTESPTLLDVEAVTWSTTPCGGNARIAVPCDGQGDPVAFDPTLRPAGSETFIVDSKSYSPTDDATTDAPVAGTWSTSPCESIERYIAYACTYSSVPPVAYRVQPGMVPGEGIVWNSVISPGFNGQTCWWLTKHLCSTDPAPDSMGLANRTQEPGSCAGVNYAQQGGCTNLEPPINPCDLPVGHPNRPAGCPGGPNATMSATAPQRSLPKQRIDDDYDPETSPDSPKARGGCCSPPEGVD